MSIELPKGVRLTMDFHNGAFFVSRGVKPVTLVAFSPLEHLDYMKGLLIEAAEGFDVVPFWFDRKHPKFPGGHQLGYAQTKYDARTLYWLWTAVDDTPPPADVKEVLIGNIFGYSPSAIATFIDKNVDLDGIEYPWEVKDERPL